MSIDPDTPSQPRPAQWSLLRKTLIAFPLVLFLAAGWSWFTANRRVQSQLDALQAQGLPATAGELNAFYKVPDGVPDRTQEWVKAIDALMAASSKQSMDPYPMVGANLNPIPPPGLIWGDFEASRQLVRDFDKEFQLIRAAASVPGQVRYPIDCSLGINAAFLSHTQPHRQVARFLVLDAYVGAHEGQRVRILDDIKSIISLSDTLRGEPFLFSIYIRSAIYVVGTREIEKWLAYCDWSDAELESLQEAVLSARFEEEAVHCLAGERANGLTEYKRFTLGPFRPSVELEYLKLMQDAIDSFSLPWPEVLQRQAAMTTRLNKLQKEPFSSIRYQEVTLLGPAIEQAGNNVARAVARQRCICVLIAAQRFRLQHGRLPDSLGEIEPSQLGPGVGRPDLRTDPFNGQPLRFKSDAEGLMIYSVGVDQSDDGGDVASTSPRKRDVGFKLLLKKEVNDPEMIRQ